MSKKFWYYVVGARQHHGKMMYVNNSLDGYTSKREKAKQFKTKKEAVEELKNEFGYVFDPMYGKEIVIGIEKEK